MKKKFQPTVLVILDGFGFSEKSLHNAIAQAHTPCFDFLLEHYPATLLKASGKAVGLPEGFAGNSEVGHLTLGCGTPVPQSFTIIEDAIESGAFLTNDILLKNLNTLKSRGGTLHIIGLLSDAAVHSHIKHLSYILQAAQQQGLADVVVHPILDGRDTPPRSAEHYLKALETELSNIHIGRIGTIQGRFYAMDRNRNWNLTKQSYEVLTEKQPITAADWHDALYKSYANNVSDEFVKPTQLDSSGIIKEGDGIIFFNFRPDRARQLTTYFTAEHVEGRKKKIPLTFFISPVSYGQNYNTISLYEKPRAPQSLTQILHDKGFSLFSIAETEKFAHVTYFFNAGREKKLEHETRVLVPSLPGKCYATHPCMSAPTITEAVIESLKTNPHDFYVINYANADMVGHTGNFEATVKAIECLDKQLDKLYTTIVEEMDGALYITGDHGNAEDMFDPTTQQPRTSHTDNPVFFILVRKEFKNSHDQLPLKELADVAPFILHLMTTE